MRPEAPEKSKLVTIAEDKNSRYSVEEIAHEPKAIRRNMGKIPIAIAFSTLTELPKLPAGITCSMVRKVSPEFHISGKHNRFCMQKNVNICFAQSDVHADLGISPPNEHKLVILVCHERDLLVPFRS